MIEKVANLAFDECFNISHLLVAYSTGPTGSGFPSASRAFNGPYSICNPCDSDSRPDRTGIKQKIIAVFPVRCLVRRIAGNEVMVLILH